MPLQTSDFIDALIVARDARQAGDDIRRYSRDVERGRLVRVRRGVYLPTEVWTALGPRDRSITRMWAYALVADRAPVFSHESAAILHGLPLMQSRDARISVAVDGTASGKPGNDVRQRPLQLDAAELCTAVGLVATTPTRTILDLASTLGFGDAVIPADAALRQRLTTVEQLGRAVEELVISRGIRKARRVVAFADPRSESPGESLSRAVIHEAGFPAPLLQYEFSDSRGFIGRVDFWWPQHNLIGEFDGRIKYQSGRFAGSPDDNLWNEKLREDRLRALGPQVARWIWSDAMSPALLAYELSRHGLPTVQRARVRSARG